MNVRTKLPSSAVFNTIPRVMITFVPSSNSRLNRIKLCAAFQHPLDEKSSKCARDQSTRVNTFRCII